MKDIMINFPTKVMIGDGMLKNLGEQASGLGKKAFVLYDPFLKGSATLQAIFDDLKACGVAYTEFDDVVPNPRNTTIDRGAGICAQEKCDVVIGIGGGSAIDSAKAIALVMTNGGTCWEYTERQNEYVHRPEKSALPLIVIPTTAGTGTEATPCAVINNPSLKRKCTIINPAIYPTVSLIDPALMTSIPQLSTALTGIDTFAHAFEAYISKNANEWTDTIALRSIELFARSIRAAVKDGSDIDARYDMALACMLGGWSIAQAGVTLPHALGQPLSAFTDAPHGGTLAACLVQIIEWTLPYGEDKFAKVAEIFDPSLVGKSKTEQAAALPELLYKLYQEIGVDVSFGGYGLKEEEIPAFVDLAYTAFKQDIDGHPKPTSREDVERLVQQCM